MIISAWKTTKHSALHTTLAKESSCIFMWDAVCGDALMLLMHQAGSSSRSPGGPLQAPGRQQLRHLRSREVNVVTMLMRANQNALH